MLQISSLFEEKKFLIGLKSNNPKIPLIFDGHFKNMMKTESPHN